MEFHQLNSRGFLLCFSFVFSKQWVLIDLIFFIIQVYFYNKKVRLFICYVDTHVESHAIKINSVAICSTSKFNLTGLPSQVLANIHSMFAIESCCACLYDTHDAALPTQFRFNVEPVLQPNAVSMPTNCLRRWPRTTLTLGLMYASRQHPSSTPANTCHLPNTVSMLAQH